MVPTVVPTCVDAILVMSSTATFTGAHAFAEPEVQDLDQSLGGHHDVARLQIAMDDAGAMCTADAVCDLNREPNRGIDGAAFRR